MRPALVGCLIVFALLVGGPAAWAEDEDAGEDDAIELPEVTVSARRKNESAEDPAAFVEVIELGDYAGRLVSTEQVLKQAAGVNIKSLGGLGSQATISIRGGGSNQVVVLVDGVRLNPAAGGTVDLSTIPPEQIERIEVIRGGDAAFFGEGAVGGVVNIVTKRAGDGPKNSAAGAYGSFNTWRLAASRRDEQGPWRYFAGGSYLHTDGNYSYESDNGTALDDSDDYFTTRVNNELDARNLLVRAGYAPEARIDLTVQNDFYASDAGAPGSTTFPSRYAHKKTVRDLAAAQLALTGLGLPSLSFATRLTGRYEWARFRDGAGEQTGVPLVTDRVETEPALRQSVDYAWGTHQLISLGGEVRHIELRADGFDDPSRDAWAVSLSDQVMLWRQIVTLVAAARYDHTSDLGGQWSPKGGLRLRPVEPLTLKGNIGRSFRAPNFSELYFNEGLVIGNPDLKPETARHLDAGLQLDFPPWVFFEGAYFQTRTRDLIEYVLTNGFRYKPFNIGRARLEGMELSLRATPVAWLTASGAYTLTYAIDETDDAIRRGRQIPGRPRQVGYGRLEGHAGIVGPFVEFNHVGENYLTAAGTKTLAARDLWNAGAIFSVAPGSRLGFEMKNLTDETAVDVRGFPLPGRAAYLTLEREF
jgi:vitamin B12 transporter